MALLRAGLTTGQAARRVGVCKSSVQRWARAAGVKTARPSPPLIPRSPRRLRGEELMLLGLRDSEIAAELDVSRACVNQWRQALGIVGIPLTNPDREEAIRLLTQGLSAAEISARLKISRHTVQTWRRQVGLPRSAPMPRNDLAGRRFGLLLALETDPERTGKGLRGLRRTYWRCRCDCGRDTSKRRDDLICGRVRSCGCLLRRSSRGHAGTHRLPGGLDRQTDHCGRHG